MNDKTSSSPDNSRISEEKFDCNQMVSQFHQLFDLPIIDNPNIPSKDRIALRLNLIKEELQELEDAINADDLLEVADAFCDIQYVLSGAILEFGLNSRFQSMFREVHRSNMSKACLTKEIAKNTQEYYKKEKNTDSYILQNDRYWVVHRKEDGKVLKSIKYSPANIQQFLL